MRLNRGSAVVLLFGMIALGSCTSSRPEPSRAATSRPLATTTRPGQVVASTSALRGIDDGEAASSLVAKAQGRLPYSPDVLDCVARRASEDEELLAALRELEDSAKSARADAAAASCVIEVRTAPRFAEDLQRAANGSLSDEQITCAVREFARLTPEQVEAAAGAVLNPEKAERRATAPVEKIYERCRIEVGGG